MCAASTASTSAISPWRSTSARAQECGEAARRDLGAVHRHPVAAGQRGALLAGDGRAGEHEARVGVRGAPPAGALEDLPPERHDAEHLVVRGTPLERARVGHRVEPARAPVTRRRVPLRPARRDHGLAGGPGDPGERGDELGAALGPPTDAPRAPAQDRGREVRDARGARDRFAPDGIERREGHDDRTSGAGRRDGLGIVVLDGSFDHDGLPLGGVLAGHG